MEKKVVGGLFVHGGVLCVVVVQGVVVGGEVIQGVVVGGVVGHKDVVEGRVAELAREHGWHPPKSLDSDENFKPEHTLFCRELRFVAIYALFLEVIFSEVGFFCEF